MYIYIRSSNRIALAETPAASTYLSFSCYLEDEGHERNDGGGSNDEADPTSLLCQPHSLFLGIHSPGVKGRPRSGQEALDSAAAAALLGCHRLLSLLVFCSLAQSRVTDRHNQTDGRTYRRDLGGEWRGWALLQFTYVPGSYVARFASHRQTAGRIRIYFACLADGRVS